MSLYFASPLMRSLRDRFARIYGEACADRCLDRLGMMVGRYGVGRVTRDKREKWSARDAVLITYADMIEAPDRKPLDAWKTFADRRLRKAFNTVHLLPFFPFSSDDGFSVLHYRQVRPDLGNWPEIRAVGEQFALMMDLVLNHVSAESGWFTDYRTAVAPGRHYFIEADPDADLAAVVRPRTSPLLTPVQTRDGLRHVWTTFSADQVDLNYANPDVLFEMLDLVLFYIANGARIIRLDAIAYLWKKPGTSCIHLPETHEVVKLLRDFLKLVSPDAVLITETNVPHEENVAYFGNGDEAHMVYQFALPPLVLDALVSGTAARLTAWAARLRPPPHGCTFLNFTASHDGVGVRPLQNLAPAGALDRLVAHVRARGGQVSSKTNADGSESPYELNITWFDAMGAAAPEPAGLQLARHLCSQTIPLSLQGIPAVYFHALTATPNDQAAFKRTGRARSLNRGQWALAQLEDLVEEKGNDTGRSFREISRRLALRADHPAFHPDGAQRILDVDPRLFVVERTAPDGKERILAIHNVASEPVPLEAPIPGDIESDWLDLSELSDLLSPARKPVRTLAPYDCAWLVRG